MLKRVVERKLLPASQRNTLPLKPRGGKKNARPIAQQTASQEQLHPSHPPCNNKKKKKRNSFKVVLEGSRATDIFLFSGDGWRQSLLGVGVSPTMENNSVVKRDGVKGMERKGN